nr:uncharacterized protein LOC123494926 [Aegilops tauschii subsp. strangulata]
MTMRSSPATIGRAEGCYGQLGDRRMQRREWPVLGWPETRPVMRFGGGGRAAARGSRDRPWPGLVRGGAGGRAPVRGQQQVTGGEGCDACAGQRRATVTGAGQAAAVGGAGQGLDAVRMAGLRAAWWWPRAGAGARARQRGGEGGEVFLTPVVEVRAAWLEEEDEEATMMVGGSGEAVAGRGSDGVRQWRRGHPGRGPDPVGEFEVEDGASGHRATLATARGDGAPRWCRRQRAASRASPWIQKGSSTGGARGEGIVRERVGGVTMIVVTWHN